MFKWPPGGVYDSLPTHRAGAKRGMQTLYSVHVYIYKNVKSDRKGEEEEGGDTNPPRCPAQELLLLLLCIVT